MPSNTNLYMNFSGVTIVHTPPGGSASTITLTKVTDVNPDVKTKQEMFFGDALKYPVMIAPTERTRGIEITSGDVYKCLQIGEDDVCVVTAILNDVKNGVGTGAITMVLSNAMVENRDFKAPNNKFATGTIKFNAYGLAGDLDPLSITQAA